MELWALDQHTQIGRITTATRVQIIERDLAEGGWLVEMPLGSAGDVSGLMLSSSILWPGIEVHDPDTGWRFGGYLTGWTIIVDAEGVETVRLVGRDFQSDLAGWLEWPEYTTVYEWWSTTVGGTVPRTTDLRNTVELNAGSAAAPGRDRIYGLVLGPDPAGGDPMPRRLKGEPLLDVARTLLWGTSWTARLRLQRDASGAPSMVLDTLVRPLAPIQLNVKRGTVGRLELGMAAAEATWVIGMGGEVSPVVIPGQRHVAVETQFEADWRERHRERMINRPATDDFEALAAEVATLANGPDSAWGRSAKVDQVRVDGYGRDLDLGWLVDVQLGATFQPPTVRLPVVASTLDFTPETGWVRTVDVGVESLAGPAGVHATIGRVRADVRHIEADSR
jgi:hypothetical protein